MRLHLSKNTGHISGINHSRWIETPIVLSFSCAALFLPVAVQPQKDGQRQHNTVVEQHAARLRPGIKQRIPVTDRADGVDEGVVGGAG